MILLRGINADESNRPEPFKNERITVGHGDAFVETAVEMEFSEQRLCNRFPLRISHSRRTGEC